MATASENTSRPQPWVIDSGVRNCPSAERGPNAIIATAQPHRMTTSGVRQPSRDGVACETAVITAFPFAARPGESRALGATRGLRALSRLIIMMEMKHPDLKHTRSA